MIIGQYRVNIRHNIYRCISCIKHACLYCIINYIIFNVYYTLYNQVNLRLLVV